MRAARGSFELRSFVAPIADVTVADLPAGPRDGEYRSNATDVFVRGATSMSRRTP